jgi:peptidoglycan hydrolase CwlO-like protein
MNKTKRNLFIIFTITLGIIAEIVTYQHFYGRDLTSKADENPKAEIVEKIQKIDNQIDELHGKEKITQENWIKEGDLLLEKEELEKELDREEYYKKILLEDISYGFAIIKQLELDKQFAETTEKIEECDERIQKLTEVYEKYNKKVKNCENYENLYNQLMEEYYNVTDALNKKYRGH